MDVWIIESGDYEQHGVDGVASTLHGAVEFIKDRYGPPYSVTWEELYETTWEYDNVKHARYNLVGDFDTVPGYSVKHRAAFEISAIPLFESPC